MRRRRLRLGRAHEPDGRRAARGPGARGLAGRRGDRAGHGRRARRARDRDRRSSPPSPRRRASSPRCRGRPAGCSSPGRRVRGGCWPTSSAPDVVPLYRTVELRPERFPAADLVVLASASAARAYAALGAPAPAVSIGPRDLERRARGRRGRRGRGGHARPGRARRRRSPGRRYAPPPMKHRFITFLTDFGLQDDFVGTCHGVMKGIAPDVQIIDITHGIPRAARAPGRARALQHAELHAGRRPPRGRRPGRGRQPPPARAARRQRPALRRPRQRPPRPRRGEARRHRRTPASWRTRPTRCPPVSRTFHGRDLFSPAAAHLALGVAAGGARAAASTPRRSCGSTSPTPAVAPGGIRAVVLYVDGFGNMQLNLTREHLDEIDVVPGTRVELEFADERYYAVAARTFGDARQGRHHPVRGLLPEHRRRHQRRQGGRDVRRPPRPARCASARSSHLPVPARRVRVED